MTDSEKLEAGAKAAYEIGTNRALSRAQPWPPNEPEAGYWREIAAAVISATTV